jgi:hypothetical protein
VRKAEIWASSSTVVPVRCLPPGTVGQCLAADIFGCHDWREGGRRVLLVWSGWRLGALLNILQHAACLTTENICQRNKAKWTE